MSAPRANLARSDPAYRAVIDIGSNTVRLVVYGAPFRAPTVRLNERVTARLGRELGDTGRLPEDGMAMALEAVGRFRALLDRLGVQDVETVATAAPREAENGREFLKAVAEHGFDPRLLSGVEEAETSAQGVLGAFPGAQGIVADLGGGSLELVDVAAGESSHGISLPLGTLRLAALRDDGREAFSEDVAELIRSSDYDIVKGQTLYLVGGSLRAFARFVMVESGSPLEDPHGFRMSLKTARKMAKSCMAAYPSALQSISGVSSSRSAMLPDTAALLRELLAALEPSDIVVSAWGLREGLIYRGLPKEEQARDPFLAGVEEFTGPRGGSLDLARIVADWCAPVSQCSGDDAVSISDRVQLGATMLALASASLEPNIRRRHVVDWALHKRWLAIDPDERALICAALLANTNATEPPKELRAIARPEALEAGIRLGLAIRLCRKIAANTAEALSQTGMVIENRGIVLRIEEAAGDLYAPTVERGLEGLSARLGMTHTVEIRN